MKHLFIVNPNAGGKNKSEEIRIEAEKIFSNRSEDEFEIYLTKGPKDASSEIRRRAESGEEFIVYACGGDGTINECANGAANYKNVFLAPYASGTGNDFCRSFGKDAQLFRDLNALVNGKPHPIDLIDVNGTYSIDISSVGIDARIGTNVHNYSKLPLIGNSFAYIISTVVEVFRGINTHLKIDCGDYHKEGEFALCCVCNGRCYGGGFQPSLDAMPDDGILDIFICSKMTLLQLALNIGKYAAGKSDSIPQFITHIKGTEITIQSSEQVCVNIDGEKLISDNIKMQVVPNALNLIIPNGMTFFE